MKYLLICLIVISEITGARSSGVLLVEYNGTSPPTTTTSSGTTAAVIVKSASANGLPQWTVPVPFKRRFQKSIQYFRESFKPWKPYIVHWIRLLNQMSALQLITRTTLLVTWSTNWAKSRTHLTNLNK